MKTRSTFVQGWQLISKASFILAAVATVAALLFIFIPSMPSKAIGEKDLLALTLLGLYVLLVLFAIIVGITFRMVANQLKKDFMSALDNQMMDTKKHDYLVDCFITVENRKIKNVVIFSPQPDDGESSLEKFLVNANPADALILIGKLEAKENA